MTWLAKIPLGLFLSLSVAFVVLGDYFAKSWSVSSGYKTTLLIVAIIFYMLDGLLYALSLINGDLSKTSIVWNILNLLAAVLIGVLIFKEVFTTTQIVGAILGVIGVVLLSI